MKPAWMGLAMALTVAVAGCASSKPNDYIDYANERDVIRCEDEAHEEGLSQADRNAVMQACLDGRGYRRHQRGY
ncbi:hypothetical protein [Ottowia testudinis]|uniref:Entry exclusion lipoprotein TrbK n=1 Tax=Ottowia testudinis TaxID=2816950 RepID=A0A975CJV0_9BURK|nr:hypothetical protein [Ottowia testudinis]QTD46929.1 hypothetical protein J1M35_08695 [Ottowia testudinis]